MKNCFRTKKVIIAALSAIVSAAATVLPAGCTREGDNTLGYEFLPENQRFEMRHKSFKGGVVRKYDAKSDQYINDSMHRFFETSHFRTDSLISSNLQVGYFGRQRDTEGIFGLREAGFATEFLFTSTIGEDGFGYLPIFDSMQLALSITEYTGDTIRPMRYTIYEITGKSLTESMTEANGEDNKRSYINHDMSGLYDPAKPLFTFTFPDSDHGIYTSTANITLKPEDMNGATWDFIKRLMLVGDLDDGWDGYADDIAVYKSDEEWVDAFKGIYIKPADDDELADGEEGNLFATDFSATGLLLYGRNRNPEEPRLIKDTVSMGYVFYDANATGSGNKSINYVKHDYEGSLLAEAAAKVETDKERTTENVFAWREENRKNHVQSETVYVEGMGGMATELYFTDDFLCELRNICEGENDDDPFTAVSINQALMYVYLENADYDWDKLEPGTMTPLLDAAQSRLGLYTSLESVTPVSDYNYYYESYYGTALAYGGYLGRSLCCYTMDISSYIQELKNYVDGLEPDADGHFEFDSTNQNAVSRTLYIAPEAYSMYGFSRSRLQGMENSDWSNASIRLELTYTMMKK